MVSEKSAKKVCFIFLIDKMNNLDKESISKRMNSG